MERAGKTLHQHSPDAGDDGTVRRHEPRPAEPRQGRGRLRGRLPDGRPAPQRQRGHALGGDTRPGLRRAGHLDEVRRRLRGRRRGLLDAQAHGGAPAHPAGSAVGPPYGLRRVRALRPLLGGARGHRHRRRHHLPGGAAVLLAEHAAGRRVLLRRDRHAAFQRRQGPGDLRRLA